MYYAFTISKVIVMHITLQNVEIYNISYEHDYQYG